MFVARTRFKAAEKLAFVNLREALPPKVLIRKRGEIPAGLLSPGRRQGIQRWTLVRRLGVIQSHQ